MNEISWASYIVDRLMLQHKLGLTRTEFVIPLDVPSIEEIEEQKGLLNKITENSREVCRLNEIHEWKNKEVEKIKFWLTIANTELDQERTNCQIKIEQLEKTRKNYISNKVYYS